MKKTPQQPAGLLLPGEGRKPDKTLAVDRTAYLIARGWHTRGIANWFRADDTEETVAHSTDHAFGLQSGVDLVYVADSTRWMCDFEGWFLDRKSDKRFTYEHVMRVVKFWK